MFGKDLQVKKNAVPSLFKLLPPSLPNHNIPEVGQKLVRSPELTKCHT